MKKAFAILISCLLLSSQLGLGMILTPNPSAPAECKHCPCGGKASCCLEGDTDEQQSLPALPQRQAKFQAQPDTAALPAKPVFKLPQVALEFSSLPQPLQLKVAGVPMHKWVCRYLT